VAPDPEVCGAPVPDPADPVAGVSALSVDGVLGVTVALADAEPLGDTDWLGDDDRVGVVVAWGELVAVVVGVGLRQPPDGVVVTVCLTAGLCVGPGFVEVLVGFGVGVELLLALGLTEVLVLALGLALPLALTVLVGLDVLGAGLLDWSAVLVFAAAFDELGEAPGDGEHDAIVPDVLPPADPPVVTAPLPSAVAPPEPGDGAGLCELLRPESTKIV
jgi:hypothetical protein